MDKIAMLKKYGHLDFIDCPKCGVDDYLPTNRFQGSEDLPDKIGKCHNVLCSYNWSREKYLTERGKYPGINNYWLLRDYKLTDLNTCPACNRFHVFIPYENIETLERLPPHVGKCLHKACSYEFETTKFFKDNQKQTAENEINY